MSDALPTRLDISPTDGLNLDEREALKHFAGKSREQARTLFEDNALFYSGDLLWMGPKAFAYYFDAFADYLKSSVAKGDASVLFSFATLIERRIEEDETQAVTYAAKVLECVRFCVENYPSFSVDEEIYDNLRENLERLDARLSDLVRPS